MGKRIITTENLEEDIKIEGELRPQFLTDYIWQEKAKQTLSVYISAEKRWTTSCSTDRPDSERRRWPASSPMKWGYI